MPYGLCGIGNRSRLRDVKEGMRSITALTRTALALACTMAMASCIADDPDAVSPSTTLSPPASTQPSVPTTGPTRVTGPFGASRLLTGADCSTMLTALQDIALDNVTAWGFDGPDYWRTMPAEEAVEMAVDDMAGADMATEAPAAEADFSDTNTQEAGVDEADIIETDGRYIYTVDTSGVTIIDIAAAAVAGTIDLVDGDHRLLLANTTLTVITSPWDRWNTTVVTRFDVSDPAQVTALHTDELEGSLVAARSADGVVRVILRTTPDRLFFVTPDGFSMDEERALERNRQVILESTIADWLPRRIADDGSAVAAVDCANMAIPDVGASPTLTWVASLDLGRTEPAVGSIALAGGAETVYATQRSLHVASTDWSWENGDTATVVHSFSMTSGTAIDHVASGEVPGYLIGQFALNEFNGDLRVASTHTVDGVSRSRVAVLRPTDGELVEVGAVDDLGLTEQIYAVRYIGALAYVVTFRQTDPLYVLDLSNAEAPVMRGELKIPGYSSYLHPIGDGLLLGLGQDATNEGRTTGTQLSLFDVSNPDSPTQLARVHIGGWSDAEWNHLAFLYWPADGTVAVPRGDGSVVVMRVVDRDIIVVGEIAPTSIVFDDPAAGVLRLDDLADDVSASSVVDDVWPVEPDYWDYCWDPVNRSLVVGDELITVANSGVAMYARDDLTWRRGLELRSGWC